MKSSPADPVARPLASVSAVDVLLSNGRIARIRPVVPGDRLALERLHDEASDDAVRWRFFTTNRATGRQYADHLADPYASLDTIALVAEYDGEVVAVGSAEIAGVQTAEVAFLVADVAHGLGFGTLLLEHLAAAARDRGIRRFTAEVLSDNGAMAAVFRDAGFDQSKTMSGGVTSLELDTAATERAVAAADRRECAAERRSLQPVLHPRSVAIVGVRRDGSGIGHGVLAAVVANGFAGEVYVVHPADLALDGCTVVPDLASIGHPVDVVVIAVPAARVLDVGRQAAAVGAGALVVVSSGFGELGDEGRLMQRQLVELARTHSMRVIGPNCLGLMVNRPDLRLNASFARTLPEIGGLALASQSGGVGLALLDAARESGLGLAYFVSLGNKADVSGNDLLAAWLEDDAVTAAALYLESFGNPRKFARVARRFSEHKPLLAIMGGRSDGGRRAGLSHTASAAAPSVGVEALFHHAGVIACDSVAQLADAARLLELQPLPSGPRVGIVSNAGGLGVLAADRAGELGLVVPEFDDALQASLAGLVSSTAGVSNPVDLGAGVSAERFGGAVADVVGSGQVDGVLVVIAGTGISDTTEVCLRVAAAHQTVPSVPVMFVAVGDVTVPAPMAAIIPRFDSVEDSIDAFSKAARYAAWRAAPAGVPHPADPAIAARARAAVAPIAYGESEPHRWLPVEEIRELLSCYGIEGPVGTLAQDSPAAATAAARIGFPVVAKVADPDIVHKTDRGLVRVGLTSVEGVAAAVRAFASELDRDDFPVLVQPQLSGGVEVAVGLVNHDAFGPLVMVAAGGVATDVWGDRVFLVPPITDVDAARAVRSLRIWPLLAGFRGSPPVDVAALERLVAAVGRMADDVPEIAEVDLNPVILTPRGATVVDVRVRVCPSDGVPDAGIPRRLRAPR
jgi:acyl-CoA synthetase (NDP forming)/GNAT superfamily N-acetyltransferase